MDELKQVSDVAQDCRAQLIKISEHFKSVAVAVKAMEESTKSIERIWCGKLPQCEIGDLKLPRNDLADNAFGKALSSLYKGKSDEERIKILLEIVKKIMPAIADYERKVAKLGERITMQSQSAERDIAIRQKQKLTETIRVLMKRVENVIDRFFKYRKTILLRILGDTEMFVEQFVDEHLGLPKYYRDIFVNKLKAECAIEQYRAFNAKLKMK